MKFRFPVVIIDEDFRSENTSGLGVRALADAIQKEGFEVLGVTSFGDMASFAQQQSRASTFVLSIDDEEFGGGSPSEMESALRHLRAFVQEIRWRNAHIPIFLYGETRTSRHIPNDVLKELHGFIHLFEDTPEFVARHIAREARVYLDSLAPPFFRALTHYASDGSYSWHCPGHSGGVAFLKSPVGQMFHQFFGENMLRADVCNAVDELGQLLDHTGPVAASERNAARIFNADHLFFVTNGTSTSNKIVWHSTVAAGDVVVVDRNCHKSILHAIIMTGAIPVFLMPTRNHYGIIGPIPLEEFKPENIQRKIAANPFAQNSPVQPRVLTLTQSTYDGILYNVETIKKLLDGVIDTLHFDEAWLPHASFSDFYKDMHAIGRDRPICHESMVMSTQSTHKLLAGLSQASQILVQDSEMRKLDRDCFNEAYLMHTSTSPQYAIIASCDVAAAMMESPGGTALLEESISEALDFRRAMRKVDEEWGTDWWFKVWGPDYLAEEGGGERSDWMLKPGERWHGFGNLAPGFNMLDPIKATVITPGLDVDGDFHDIGIPAAVVTKYLAEHGVVVEKTGLYSFFIMFTIGITKGRWNTLVTELQQFKDDYDKNQPLWRILPEFVAKYPRYENWGLRQLSDQIHEVYRANDVARLTTEMYLSDMVPAMKPADAFARMAHRETERVGIDDLEGRITSVLLTPYPPGIPLLIPGECFNATIVRYLQFARSFNQRFPGFETDIHGLSKTGSNGESKFYVDCVRL
ncbi:arginine/lysine/ornithine decarboxylase [Ferrovum myxofaciens]|jgi:arginine decarboxylase|uniref:Arginine/lysine/ornithine decarboxylase n=2 Tax=root TaxID=1 RepID=A0A8F3DU77_9PROT|nr:arginine/lysine/ornithine decarboxylase [Ferrovum myxofaciens]KXW57914.1 biodegradative arginine decarboxylase [Ferrovum myxofaciens]MBU6993541.1 arginine/lysine/ornithine decarboxylase [Ferrovum myxofaciens]QKE37472.1 MAG: arginine/lysine/ornithine decarboxylase [Ferrovum myxofaciens]QKE40038.1 MAG: arginine/lysine/ornithine decarboxylase [Ferrovum myxofaciens]QWY75122.1 MAG: arginine/lysine/ornithine decarboxylase [Ferrovum myxofaciens]